MHNIFVYRKEAIMKKKETRKEKAKRLERNKYFIEYRKANAEKIKEINRKYWQKKLAEYDEQDEAHNS